MIQHSAFCFALGSVPFWDKQTKITRELVRRGIVFVYEREEKPLAGSSIVGILFRFSPVDINGIEVGLSFTHGIEKKNHAGVCTLREL
jgi:hypothetical protein